MPRCCGTDTEATDDRGATQVPLPLLRAPASASRGQRSRGPAHDLRERVHHDPVELRHVLALLPLRPRPVAVYMEDHECIGLDRVGVPCSEGALRAARARSDSCSCRRSSTCSHAWPLPRAAHWEGRRRDRARGSREPRGSSIFRTSASTVARASLLLSSVRITSERQVPLTRALAIAESRSRARCPRHRRRRAPRVLCRHVLPDPARPAVAALAAAEDEALTNLFR